MLDTVHITVPRFSHITFSLRVRKPSIDPPHRRQGRSAPRRSTGRSPAWDGHPRGPILRRSLNLKAEVDDSLPAGARQAGQPGRVRQAGQALPLVRAPEGVLVLPGRRRQRGPHPGGPGRPLQGDPRLPLGPRVVLPQLRRALHHAPDHHRGQDGHAQQAHAAQRLRLVLHLARRASAASGEPTLDEILPGSPVWDPANQVDLHRGTALAGRRA